MAAQPFFAAGIINGVGHRLGYRSFEMASTATNIVPWGLLVGGEELHNNHHAFPRSACFAVQPWEIDIGWLWIRLFRALGLAEVRRVAPHPHLIRARSTLDADTVRALFTNRMHVLRDYARRVVKPVCRELARREPEGAVPRIASMLLIRHPALLADEARRMLSDLLARYEVLRAVVEFREGLQHAWNLPRPIKRAPCNSCGSGAYVPRRVVFAPCASLPWDCATTRLPHRFRRYPA
jgi:stearoyl-CoA desaturase (delta-9 desaturase)